MKVSLSWLQSYLATTTDAQTLANGLTMAGLEIDTVTDRYAYLKTVRVGRIDAVTPHPNADRLVVCAVNLGDRAVTVVCGAPNVVEGMLAPLALPGTILPDGREIEKGLIRKVASEGMLCNAVELGLGPDASGLMVLAGDLPVGADLAQALNLSDAVFEIDITPNRADCLSVLGIAREVAAIENTTVQYPQVKMSSTEGPVQESVSVTIDAPHLCPRYAAALLENVTIGTSPDWLCNRLLSVGQRPINNVVDITNFVMLEQGQPLHAFDFERLARGQIIVRCATEGEAFTTLDGKGRNLSAETLMICDGEKPVAVGGVMGGLNSEIEPHTTKVLLESANFNPAGIRKTARRFGLSTDASYRFERGVDRTGAVCALERAAHLMVELCGARRVEGIVDVYPEKYQPVVIDLSVAKTNRVLGTDLTAAQMAAMLTSIEFDVTRQDDEMLRVKAPSYRMDMARPEDLMEEIARLWGYNKIPTTYPSVDRGAQASAPAVGFRDKIKDFIVGWGFDEVVAYAFNAPADYDHLNLSSGHELRRLVPLLNPLTEAQGVMRTSLLPGLLGTVKHNFTQQLKDLRLFEVGKTFFHTQKDQLPEEKELLAVVWTGARKGASWHSRGKSEPCDYFDIKGLADVLLATLKINAAQFVRPAKGCYPYLQAGVAAEIVADAKVLGAVGVVDGSVANHWDIDQPLMWLELDMTRLAETAPAARTAAPISRYPATDRDLTVIVDRDMEVARLLAHLNEHANHMEDHIVEAIDLLDIFAEDPIPAGKKSITLRLTYRSFEGTLKDETINVIHAAITRKLIDTFEANLPA